MSLRLSVRLSIVVDMFHEQDKLILLLSTNSDMTLIPLRDAHY